MPLHYTSSVSIRYYYQQQPSTPPPQQQQPAIPKSAVQRIVEECMGVVAATGNRSVDDVCRTVIRNLQAKGC
jgi:hypothetical protein